MAAAPQTLPLAPNLESIEEVGFVSYCTTDVTVSTAAEEISPSLRQQETAQEGEEGQSAALADVSAGLDVLVLDRWNNWYALFCFANSPYLIFHAGALPGWFESTKILLWYIFYGGTRAMTKGLIWMPVHVA